MSAGDVEPEYSARAREGAMAVVSGCRAPVYCQNWQGREENVVLMVLKKEIDNGGCCQELAIAVMGLQQPESKGNQSLGGAGDQRVF